VLDRIAIYVIPTAAVATVAVVLLGPGARRPAVAARVRGVPVQGSSVLALRIDGVRRLHHVDDTVALDGLRLEGKSGDQPLEAWEGATGPDGVAEAILRSPQPLRGSVELRLTRAGTVLAEGRVDLRAARPYAFQLASVGGTLQGELALRVDAVRGQFASPFPDPLRVSVLRSDGSPVGAGVNLTLTVQGGEAVPPATVTDARGSARVMLEPLSHAIDLTVEAKDPAGRTGRWEGHLPVRPGAIWLDDARYASERKLILISPAPRDRAYVSVLGENGRIHGAAVPLARDPLGFFSGELTVPPVEDERLLFAIVAGDPLEQGAGTAAWPLTPSEGSPAMRAVEPLLDGLPDAEARESRRLSAARQVAAAMLAIGATLEVLMLVLGGRASQKRLESHLDRVLADPGGAPATPSERATERAAVVASAQASPHYRTAAAAALVVLAFAIVGSLMMVVR
jgi:hypothetical protein